MEEMNFPLTQFHTILEGLLLGLDSISALIGAFVFFAITQFSRNKRSIEEDEQRARDKTSLRKFGGRLALAGFVGLLAAHIVLRMYPVLPEPLHLVGPTSAWALVVGVAAAYFIYRQFEAHLRHADAIRYSVILATAIWIMVICIMMFLFWLYESGEELQLAKLDSASFAQYVNTFAQVAGILVAATMVVVTNRRDAQQADETARAKIYQTLELASVDLFRFEISNPDLAKVLWTLTSIPMNFEEVDRYRLKEYTCQILNLFEMACRFRRKEIMEAEVFGSWVIWMWELCQQPVFREQWEADAGMAYNYVQPLRNLLQAGLSFADGHRHPENLDCRKVAFFVYAAEEFASETDYRVWLRPPQVRPSELHRCLTRARDFV